MTKKKFELSIDDWEKVETLYISALAVDSDGRKAYLEHNCADPTLRAEVLSLLAAYDSSPGFLEEPAFSFGLRLMQSDINHVGEVIDRYNLLKLLGRGGMGEVYLAYDPRLDRHIALKLLSSQITHDKEQTRRFQREARLASSISHPNVAHIYEMGESGGQCYITMEYVAGNSLRQLLSNGPIDKRRAIDITIQILDALKAAHESGIMHRDIKPENVMLRDDGYVKVLDFGIAKLTDETRTVSLNATQDTSLHTDPSLMIGTIHYMSPELLRKHKVDQKSDLWSLGVVLHEALLGYRPFEGDALSQTLVAILETEPLTNETNLSNPLQKFLKKALQKDPAERYQTAVEMQAELLAIQQSEFAVDNGVSQGSKARRSGVEPKKQLVTIEFGRPATIATRLETEKTEVRNHYPFSRLYGWAKPILVTAFVVVLAAISYKVFFAKHAVDPSREPFNLQFERLNLVTGALNNVAISPDGKFIASIVSEGDKQAIHIVELATSSDLRIVPPSGMGYSALSFSSDGNYVYFLENQVEGGDLYRVSKLGGSQRKLLPNVDTAVSFAKDGQHIAFTRHNHTDETTELIVSLSDGGEQRVVRTRSRADGDFFVVERSGASVAWSPDQKVIAVPTLNVSRNPREMNVEIIDPETGTSRRLNPTPWYDISGVTWLSNGRALVISASVESSDPSQLFWLSYPEGTIRRITTDPTNYQSLTGPTDNSRFLSLGVEENSSIWLIPRDNADSVSPLSVKQRSGVSHIDAAPSGSFVYTVSDGQHLNLWMQDPNGQARQLTFEESDNYRPTVTLDSKFVVFVSNRGKANARSIWRMNLDGTNPKQLTFGPYEDMPSITPDGRWVVFRTQNALKKVSIDGGQIFDLLTASTLYPVVSPDGKKLAFLTSEKPNSKQFIVRVADLQTLNTVRNITLPESANPFVGLRWSPDGSGISYVAKVDGAANVWWQPLVGGQAQQITRFKDGEIQSFSWTTQGDRIIAVRNIKTTIPLLVKIF